MIKIDQPSRHRAAKEGAKHVRGRRTRRPSLHLRRPVAIFIAAALSLGSLIGDTPPTLPPSRGVPVTAVVFNPDATQLIVGGHHSVKIHAVLADHRVTTNLPFPFPKVSSLVFSPDGGTLAASGGTPGVAGGMTVWKWPSLEPMHVLTNHTDQATGISYHPAGTLLATASADGSVQVFHWPQMRPAYRLTGHAGPVLAVAFSPDGEHLVTAGADRSIKVWDASAGNLRRSFNQHTDRIHCLAFRPPQPGTDKTSPFCVSGSQDQTVRIWQPGLGRLVRIVRGHEGPVLAVAWNPAQGCLYSAGKEGVVRAIDAASDQILHQWAAHSDWIYSLAVSPNGALLATGDWAGAIKIWEVNNNAATLRRELR